MKHIEEDLQQTCCRWMAYQYPKEYAFLHHSPNGGKRNAREAARFKAMGTKAGFPDLQLCLPRRGKHGLFIELKTDKGTQTEYQKNWQKMLTSEGYAYLVCRSFEQFCNIINKYLQAETSLKQ